jgi:hypothetical protein
MLFACVALLSACFTSAGEHKLCCAHLPLLLKLGAFFSALFIDSRFLSFVFGLLSPVAEGT